MYAMFLKGGELSTLGHLYTYNCTIPCIAADQTFLVTILSLILVFDVFWLILHKKVTNPVLYGLFLTKQVVLVLLVGYATIVYTAFDWRNWSIIFLMVEVIYNAFLVRSYRKGIAEDNAYQEI